MFYRWILLSSSLLILVSTAELTTRVNRLPTAAEKFPTADTGRKNIDDEDNEYRMVVNRGNDVLTSTQTQTGHYSEITLTLTAFNETFVLELKLNTYLFSSTYIEKAITNSGEVFNEVNHVSGHCYYTGSVRNRGRSAAAVSTCNGVTGYFSIGNVSYHIEPRTDQLNGRHGVFRNHDDAKTNFRCGNGRQLKWMSSINSTKSFRRSIHRMKRAFMYPQDGDKVDKVVELYIANANSQYLARESDINKVYSRTKDIVNVASLDYQAIGIYLVLVGVEVWTTSDQFAIPASNISGALSSWYTYRKNFINPFHYNDNAALITNVTFSGGVTGIAIIGSMCSNQFSGSMISDSSGQSAAAAGANLAHQMGHNFGLQDDNSIAGCTCDDTFADNHCIMYSSSNPSRPASKWSSCSKTQFATSFTHGLDICLYNIPETIFQPNSSTCGNGIVESGEQCDCGNAPGSECNRTCCSNTTCQLTASAACAYGRCCNTTTCQMKSSGTQCRPQSNDCDISEFCSGVEARCPTDSYKPDGTNCTNIGAAYCYQGQCRSHQSQCEWLWGPGTQVSNGQCYTGFNKAGAHYGNCGYRWTNTSGISYIACSAQDVMCGKLLCQNNSAALYYYQNYYMLSTATFGSYTCHSVIFDFGLGTPDPGLVPNGAKCGDGQMCVNQKCINVTLTSSISSTTATSSTSSTTKLPG